MGGIEKVKEACLEKIRLLATTLVYDGIKIFPKIDMKADGSVDLSLTIDSRTPGFQVVSENAILDSLGSSVVLATIYGASGNILGQSAKWPEVDLRSEHRNFKTLTFSSLLDLAVALNKLGVGEEVEISGLSSSSSKMPAR